MTRRAAVPAVGAGDDFADYLHARWPRLVAALEADGVPPDDARLALAEVMLQRRRGWARLVREEQVDLLVWRDVRERLGLPARSTLPPDGEGERPAGAVGEVPEDWLPRAAASLRRRRARRTRRGALALVAVALVLGALAWWDARPDPPAVRAATNPLPVTWYAAGELHLDEVVVELDGVDAFAEHDGGVAVRHTDGRVVLVAADGTVRDLDEEPAGLANPPLRVPSYDGDRFGVAIQTVRLADGGWAHLIDSSRREAQRGEVRLSETGRRAVVLCSAPTDCGAPQTIPQANLTIRLR